VPLGVKLCVIGSLGRINPLGLDYSNNLLNGLTPKEEGSRTTLK